MLWRLTSCITLCCRIQCLFHLLMCHGPTVKTSGHNASISALGDGKVFAGPQCCRVLSDFLTHTQMSKSCTLIRFCGDTRCHTVQNDCFLEPKRKSQNQCKMCQVRALKEQTQEQQKKRKHDTCGYITQMSTLKLRELGPYNTLCPPPLTCPLWSSAARGHHHEV